MNFNLKAVFSIFICCYLVYHLFTLNVHPLPWFDDSYFASIAWNFSRYGTFFPEVAPLAHNQQQDFGYGPLYFILTGISFKIFGFGIFKFRIVNFLFAIILVFISCKILQLYSRNLKMIFLFAILFALDPLFQLSLHEGRMDLTATAFIFAALYFILKHMDFQKQSYPALLLSGLLCSFSLLMNPRMFVIYFAFNLLWIVYLFRNFSKKNTSFYFAWLSPAFVVYSIWIYFAFRSLSQMSLYYKEVLQDGGSIYLSIFKSHYIPRHEYLLITLAIFSFVIQLAFSRFKTTYLHISALISLCCFYAFVVDLGSFSTLIIPFYFLILFFSAKSFNFNYKNPILYLIALLLIFNSSYSILKGLQVLSDLEPRDAEKIESFLKAHIPSGKKVLGDPVLYYAATRTGLSFEYIDKFSSLEKREKFHREIYQYEYIAISQQEKKRIGDVLKYYLSKTSCKKIASYETRQSNLNKYISGLGLLSNFENSGYSCEIYQRIK